MNSEFGLLGQFSDTEVDAFLAETEAKDGNSVRRQTFPQSSGKLPEQRNRKRDMKNIFKQPSRGNSGYAVRGVQYATSYKDKKVIKSKEDFQEMVDEYVKWMEPNMFPEGEPRVPLFFGDSLDDFSVAYPAP